MYHSVSKELRKDVHPYFEINVSPGRFEEHLRCLRENGYRAAMFEDLPRIQRDDQAPREVVITFDDGYLDFFSEAFPLLKKYGFLATVFLSTGFIGNGRASLNGKPMLAWGDVRELRRQGISFGAHTVSHPILKNLPEPALREEVTRSKQEIEEQLGEPIDAFSYPYAFPEHRKCFLKRYLDLLAECRFRFAVTTVIGRVRAGDDLLTMKRLPINEFDDLSLFRAKLDGAYDWVRIPQTLRKIVEPFAWRRM